MYNQKNRQYIMKQSSGKVWNFFYDDKHGICYSTLTRRNTWAEPVALQRNAYSSFYITLDYDDCFHLLFQDKEGNVLYSHMENENIRTVPALNSKNNTLYNKHFYMIPSKNNIQLFYIIEHNNKSLLVHQVISNGKPGNPKVIDYIIRSEVPYSVIADNSGAIYAFYQTSNGQYLQLGYKKYTPDRKLWSEFTSITHYDGDCEHPSVICDKNGYFHICYQRHTDKQFELVYRQKGPDKNNWSDETVVAASGYSFANSDLLAANNKLIIYWVREDVIQYCSSADNGRSWAKPARLIFGAGRQLFCIDYKTNYPYETEKIILRNIPGNFANGFTLAFYEDSSSNIYSLSADELRNMIVDTLKLLKANVEELRETVNGLKENMSQLKNNQQRLEREVSKNSIHKTMVNDSSGDKPAARAQSNSYKSSSLTDEQALELMKAEFLKDMKDNSIYKASAEKELLQKRASMDEYIKTKSKPTSYIEKNETDGNSVQNDQPEIDEEKFDY